MRWAIEEGQGKGGDTCESMSLASGNATSRGAGKDDTRNNTSTISTNRRGAKENIECDASCHTNAIRRPRTVNDCKKNANDHCLNGRSDSTGGTTSARTENTIRVRGTNSKRGTRENYTTMAKAQKAAQSIVTMSNIMRRNLQW